MLGPWVSAPIFFAAKPRSLHDTPRFVIAKEMLRWEQTPSVRRRERLGQPTYETYPVNRARALFSNASIRPPSGAIQTRCNVNGAWYTVLFTRAVPALPITAVRSRRIAASFTETSGQSISSSTVAGRTRVSIATSGSFSLQASNPRAQVQVRESFIRRRVHLTANHHQLRRSPHQLHHRWLSNKTLPREVAQASLFRILPNQSPQVEGVGILKTVWRQV